MFCFSPEDLVVLIPIWWPTSTRTAPLVVLHLIPLHQQPRHRSLQTHSPSRRPLQIVSTPSSITTVLIRLVQWVTLIRVKVTWSNRAPPTLFPPITRHHPSQSHTIKPLPLLTMRRQTVKWLIIHTTRSFNYKKSVIEIVKKTSHNFLSLFAINYAW